MKITKKAYNELVNTLEQLKRGQKFLMANDVHVCKDRKTLTSIDGFTSSYKENVGIALYSMNKDIGTELCYLNNGISSLEKFINNVSY